MSMRMAKTQKATLDPSKISGRCGRLMCCLRYEDETYSEFRKCLPKRNTWVRTELLTGKVVSTQTLTQLIELFLPDGTKAVVANEEIIERDVPEPKPGEVFRQVRPPRIAALPARPRSAGTETSDSGAESSDAQQSPASRKKRRRRRRKKTSGQDQAQPQDGASESKPQGAGEPSSSDGAGPPKKKRRRRRRKKKPQGDNSGGASSGGS